jgi:hypothetical protein
MPIVSLPSDFEAGLANNSATMIDVNIPGVTAYTGPNERERADVYVGFVLDGFTRYNNVSAVRPDIKMQFYVQPTLTCASNEVFRPETDKSIAIQVSSSWLSMYWNQV